MQLKAEIAAVPEFVLRHRISIITTVIALAIDQAAKLVVMMTIPLWESWPKDGVFRLTHTANFGSTLDLFSGHTIALVIVSIIGIGVLMALHWPRPKTGVRIQVTFGLMLAGTVGNLLDRVIFGHVTDFIDVVPWFIFNVADVSILIGVVSFVWDIPGESRQFFADIKK